MYIAIKMEFKNWLHNKMSECGLNARELSKKAGISESGVSLILRSARMPNVHTLQKIAPVLGVSMDDIFIAAGYISNPDNRTAREHLGKAYDFSSIRGSSNCPHCQKDIDVEVTQNGDIYLSAKVMAKAKRY